MANKTLFEIPAEDLKLAAEHEEARAKYVDLSQKLNEKSEEQRRTKQALDQATLDGRPTEQLIDELVRLNLELESLKTAVPQAEFKTRRGAYTSKLKINIENAERKLEKFEAQLPAIVDAYCDYLKAELTEKRRAYREGFNPSPAPLPAGIPGQIIALLEGRASTGGRQVIGKY